jgi:pimeloyl-ACP methyl ester carboxylesterase
VKDTSQHITNRHGLRLFVRSFIQDSSKGLIFVSHGLSDNHATPVMLALREAILGAGYSLVVWDTTHSSWGQSEGNYIHATFTNHYHDMEDVVDWGRHQPWFSAPYGVGGYSMGGTAAGSFAARHRREIDQVLLIAPVVSGTELKKVIPAPIRWYWRWRGQILQSRANQKRYSWQLIEDGLNYDLVGVAEHLTMPALIVGAQSDGYVRPKTLQRLHESIPHHRKRLVIIPKTGHRFEHTKPQLKQTVSDWLEASG